MDNLIKELVYISVVNILLFLFLSSTVPALDNGLARTPPMGWETWEHFRCNTDCKADPDNCIGEYLIKTMADYMVSEGYLAAGYQYITTGDCFLSKSRDSQGRLQPDPDRFPSGIKNLSDYVHSRGLKFGIAEDFGVKTCSGYPGSEFYLEQDAQTFADWGVDYLKFDGCYSNPKDMDEGYTAMSFYLNKTGRPIVFSCEWPFYQQMAGMKPNYQAIQKACNLWRNLADVGDSWGSVSSIISKYGEDKYNFSSYAQPGAWNDPDMLVVGNYGLSYDQSRVQMAIWAIMASPLIMSNDLRNTPDWAKELLQNPYLIAINQDPLGHQGTRILTKINGTAIQVWSKQISPLGSLALAFLYLPSGGGPKLLSIAAQDVGLVDENGYYCIDGFTGEYLGLVKPETLIKGYVNPNGVEVLVAKPAQRS